MRSLVSGIYQFEIDVSMLRASLSYFADGKGDTTVLAADEHPKLKLKSGYVQLIEVADAGTTFTAKFTDGTNDMTDTITFTQGTEAVADVKAFTISGTYHTIEKGDTLHLVTSGTTTTAGEVVATVEYIGVV